MAQIALPRQQVTQSSESAAVGSPLYQRRGASTSGPIELIPNPHFIFPPRQPNSPPEANATANPRPISLQALPTSRRGSARGPRQKSVSALPDFTFNPTTASQSSTANASPPHSPMSTTPATPSKNIGHRRRGSEFIGGDGRASGMNLLSSSPTKGDGVLPPPTTTLRPGPPAGRRGHAHRRSGAISSHDLSSIINPPTGANIAQRSGSAPVTPMENDSKPFFTPGHTVNKSVSQPSLYRPSSEDNIFQDDSTRRPPSRARVGFSDTVEYIRPLSTISSETESSMSTLRGHSVNNSISSVISNGTASPPTTRMSRPSLQIAFENEARPSTAGAILDGKQRPGNLGGSLYERKRPMSAIVPNSPVSSGSPVTPTIPTKRRGFFQRRSDSSLPPVLLSSASDSALSGSALESPLPSPSKESTEEEAMESFEKSKSRKGSLKPRKVKSWANSFIGRKGKHHGDKLKDRPPTPPLLDSPMLDEDEAEEMDFEANFDVDNTVTILTPTADETPLPKLATDFASWKPRELKRQDSDTMSPVIDLDAALGPFNTPSGTTPRSQSRGIASRRALHSAGGIQQHHRRTESAPELAPFEYRPSVIPSTSPMADVFEEDEEEEVDVTDKKSSVVTSASKAMTEEPEPEEPGIGIQVVDADGAQYGSAINWNFDDALRVKPNRKSRKGASTEQLAPLEVPKSREPTPIPTSKTEPSQSLDVGPVEVVQDFEEPRTSSLTRSSDSTITPTMSPDEPTEPKQLTVQLPLGQQSLMTPDSFATSGFSSPDFRSSQHSFDTNRLGTSASSVTDYRAMPSPQFGEPGPDLRVSVDDVPSLTSSRSTMTSAMHNAFPGMRSRNPDERSASLCSTPSEQEPQRRKRASIASLSRLIHGSSSSYGERSKLNIEQRPQSECLDPAKDPNKKKHKRLSKLMSFWKPKDTSRT